MVLKPGKVETAKAIFEKFDLDAEVIGQTTETGRLVLSQFGAVVCDIPVAPLAEDAPNYDRAWVHPVPRPPFDPARLAAAPDPAEALRQLMASPDMASRRWIWEQYDRHVMGDTLDSSQSGGDAALVRVHGTRKALAITSDCTPRYVAADPLEGGRQAVAEAWRNLTAVGATPLAMTDNLNFGNPERPAIMGQFVRAIEGMAEACAALDFPVVSGNVSLYNETNGRAIPPTPVVGGVGLVKDLDRIASLSGLEPDARLMLVGRTLGHMGASLLARDVLGLADDALGPPPPVDLAAERRNGDLVRQLIHARKVRAVHDLSDGGLACAAAEMALASDVGLVLSAPAQHMAPLAWYFGEDQARYLLAVDPRQADDVRTAAKDAGVACQDVGEAVRARHLVLGTAAPLELDLLREVHEGWLPSLMAR